ncbi:MAG: threonine synthase, partial [Halanaerobiaceae bacterium]
AAYYAYRMGLPVNKFICASNDNKILTDFISTGKYDINRNFKKTISPSMDILISSNLERFLFEISDHDSAKINKWYQDLKEEGVFRVDNYTQTRIRNMFIGEYATERETRNTIKEVYNKYNYLVDSHTAVGINVYQKYLAESSDHTPVIIASTANPYKFSSAVYDAITGKVESDNEFEILESLRNETSVEVHRGLCNLGDKKVRHRRTCNGSTIRDEILDILEIE